MTHHHARMLNEYGWQMGKEKLHDPSQHAILTCFFLRWKQRYLYHLSFLWILLPLSDRQEKGNGQTRILTERERKMRIFIDRGGSSSTRLNFLSNMLLQPSSPTLIFRTRLFSS